LDTNELIEQIDLLVQQKTLSLDAAKALSEIKDRNIDLERSVEALKKEKETQRGLRGDDTKKIEKLKKAISEWEQKEHFLLERESKALRLEMQAAHEAQRVTDHKEMFQLVFRNSVIREKGMVPVHGAIPNTIDQYGNTQYGSVGATVEQDLKKTEE